MKVTFIITGLIAGGAEEMLFKLLERSADFRQGQVITLNSGGIMTKRIRELGVHVDCLGMRPGIPNPISLLRLIAMLRKEEPDVVSTWMYHADLLGGLAGYFSGIPVVWGIRHSDLSSAGVKRSTRAVISACSLLSRKIPERIACCSYRARDAHIEAGYAADKFVILPNGFDLDQFKPDKEAQLSVRQELHLPSTCKLVGLVGRYDPAKNHEGFIQAAAAVAKSRADVHFLLAGIQVDKDNSVLQYWIREASLEGRVHALGLRDDIPRITAALDVAVSSSWGEAFPNVLGEAMSCEVPCVVTDVGDSAFIVDNTGIVVPAGDMQALADGIGQILDMPKAARQSLGAQARMRVAEQFEIGAVAQQYEVLFRQVMHGGGS